jgi:hypothetical protein
MKAIKLLALPGLVALVLVDVRAADPVKGYQAKVKVSAPTRIDWTFAISNQSMEKPPAKLGDYDSSKQTYEVFVPPTYDAKKSYPVVLFISPGNGAGGWKEWEPVCKKEGIIFASPHGAGNDCPGEKRVRIVLDVLDDLRRTYNTDPDRTYISGHSGGARMAGIIGFALPEYFGGVVACCAGVELRNEVWLRQRVIDRLSVALLTGDSDFNRGEMERFRGPVLAEVGVRSKVWVAPKTGHAVPAALLPEAFKWLEEGLPKRRELAKKHPASRMAGDKAPSREDWSKQLLAEGKERLGSKETLYSGLMQLQGTMVRWNGLAASAEARKILLEYKGRKDKPWEEEDVAEQRKYMTATARGLDAYASGPLPAQYEKQRVEMAKEAQKLWFILSQENPNSDAAKEAQKRIPELQKIIDK